MAKKATKKTVEKENQEVKDSQKEAGEVSEEQKETSSKQSDSDKETDEKADKQASKKDKKKSSKKLSKEEKLIQELTEKTEDAIENAKEWHDKYMRLSAEFDNYRKRTLKEKADLTKNANADLLTDILPVVDDFERGRDNIEKTNDLDGLKEGVDLIYTKFVEFLGKNGVKEIEAKETEFDLDFHEALTKIPAPADDLKGKVVDVIEKGYLLNDKVIRYSKVVVGE